MKDTSLQDDETSQTTLLLYGADRDVINKVLKVGLDHGFRLSMAQVIRMLVRKADVKALSHADYKAASEADDGRRKKAKAKKPAGEAGRGALRGPGKKRPN